VVLRLGEGERLPFEDARFDAAFAVNVVYFWPDPLAMCREIARVLRPGGRLALGFLDAADLARHPMTQTGIYRLHTPEAVAGILREAGFSGGEVLVRVGPAHRAGRSWSVVGTLPGALPG